MGQHNNYYAKVKSIFFTFSISRPQSPNGPVNYQNQSTEKVRMCDKLYLLITQEVFLCVIVATGTPNFECPPRHRACI